MAAWLMSVARAAFSSGVISIASSSPAGPPTCSASGDHASNDQDCGLIGSAGDAEPIEITPEEKAALTTLISQAALADGFKGKGYVRAWLQTHYEIDVSDIAGIPPEIRARVRSHALSVLERREQEAPRKASAPTTPP